MRQWKSPVGEEISVSEDEDILVIITDATTPEQQQEPNSQVVETPPRRRSYPHRERKQRIFFKLGNK